MSGYYGIRHNAHFHELFVTMSNVKLSSTYSESTGYYFATYSNMKCPDDFYSKAIMQSNFKGWSIQVGNTGGIYNAEFKSYDSSSRTINIYVYTNAPFNTSASYSISARFWAPIGTWPTAEYGSLN